MRMERKKREVKKGFSLWTRFVAAGILIPLMIFLSAFLVFIVWVLGLTIWHAL